MVAMRLTAVTAMITHTQTHSTLPNRGLRVTDSFTSPC
jgi:hypothetical protein